MRNIRNLYKDENAMGTICCGLTGLLAGTPLLPANICLLTAPCCCIPNIVGVIISIVGGSVGAVAGCMTDTLTTACAPILAAIGATSAESTSTAAVKAIRI